MTAEEKIKIRLETARYLENLADEARDGTILCKALREGAWALRKMVSYEQKRCQMDGCSNPACVCWDCYHSLAAEKAA